MSKTTKLAAVETNEPTLEPIYPKRTKAPIASFELEPLGQEERGHIQALRQAFEERFPPLPLDRNDVLIISWEEIERQFLDLCAPWDQQGPAYEIRKAAQISRHETPEQTIRWLFTLSRAATDIDTPEPRWGSGDSIPMP
ncbi:MAG: hypothetical protein V4701_11765 [Pseudomonadota bacterium]